MMVPMPFVLLIGAAGVPLARELAASLATASAADLTVIAPTTRDSWADGLKRCPDLDAHLIGADSTATHGLADALEALGFGAAWQRGSDAELALRLIRTELLHAGYSLTDAVAALAERRGLPYPLVPLSDDRGEWHRVLTADDGSRRAVHLDDPTADPAAEPVLVHDAWAASAAAVAAIAAADVLITHGSGPVIDHAISALAAGRPGLPVLAAGDYSAADILAAAHAAAAS